MIVFPWATGMGMNLNEIDQPILPFVKYILPAHSARNIFHFTVPKNIDSTSDLGYVSVMMRLASWVRNLHSLYDPLRHRFCYNNFRERKGLILRLMEHPILSYVRDVPDFDRRSGGHHLFTAGKPRTDDFVHCIYIQMM